ncbi:hypothetical protein ACFQ60_01980 [Streptomyces zhihengii]|uniref:hypothetical protein n=1 Tax=Streptomyces zhihengii TaxID=1818004 RepID=UPI001FD6212D|nr:hypothetical protein [Streptomyces zhihengii]
MATPIVVHRLSRTGGRRVTLSRAGWNEILGLARNDHDVIALIGRAGILYPETILDNPRWVEWRGGRAHQWDAA